MYKIPIRIPDKDIVVVDPIEHRVQIDLLKDVANGDIREVTTREALVRPGEEQILFLARMLYPHG